MIYPTFMTQARDCRSYFWTPRHRFSDIAMVVCVAVATARRLRTIIYKVLKEGRNCIVYLR